MAQFDVYQNTNPATNKDVPFLLDLQAELLDGLATRVVAPLFRAKVYGKPAQHLNPRFTIQNLKVVMSAAELAGVPENILGEKVGNLREQRNEIIAALDFLFTGI